MFAGFVFGRFLWVGFTIGVSGDLECVCLGWVLGFVICFCVCFTVVELELVV